MKKSIWLLTFLIGLLAVGIASADDTEIYGSTEISVKPNVLIIFDTSGSMATEDVPGDEYDPGQTYAGPYAPNAVYERYRVWWWWYWQEFASDVSLLNCPSTATALQTVGYVSDKVYDSSGNYNCGGSKKYLYLGNWRNYDASGVGAMRSRTDVAKEVITNLINDTTNVRFGLMRFNNNQGGYVVREVGAATADLLSSVAGFPANGYTPLAETLAEAGLYYAGKSSWFNSGVNYTSPMQYKCQKNYIILMTDGDPTYDNDSKLYSTAYINGDIIGDYDNDGQDPGSYSSYGSDYLDDVAAYLYQNDLSTSMGEAGDSFEVQNVVTYTIGFKTEQTLLMNTAANGGGKYFTANSISGLKAAFDEIMADIADVNSVFVSPVVPVSQMNKAYAGDRIYIGFFKPEASGRWSGNVKKFGIGTDGSILDADGIGATLPNGKIKDNARSYWSTTTDGPDVKKGGVGAILLDNTNRNIYTYLGSEPDLTSAANAFAISNSDLTAAMLDAGTAAERETIINDIHGVGRDWILGDILHSDPAIVDYSSKRVIFVGSNDGMIHCFDDDTGDELWAFIPQEQLERLKLLSDSTPQHDYYLDAALKLYDDGSQKVLFFGQRRGGNFYYALDVTNYSSPRWLYRVAADKLGGGDALLGQSWGVGTPIKIRNGAGAAETVFILPGGYDNNQDNAAPAATDSVGRAVFAINAANGSLSSLNFNASSNADMTHSIVDVVGVDISGDGIATRIYAPDLGGQIFAFEDGDGDGTWNKRRLFTASDAVTQRKIFYAPDITTYTVDGEIGIYDMIFFGTGDRAHPTETSMSNRFYCVKNNWAPMAGFATLTENDLYDVTEDRVQIGGATERDQVLADIEAANGWYIVLEHTGEKVISTPVVYNKVVYFATYSPDTSTPSGSDPCEALGGSGVGRLYAVNYETGAAVHDYDPTPITDGDGEDIDLGKSDRIVTEAPGIISPPIVVVLEGGPKIMLGVEGGVLEEDAVKKVEMHMYFWREISN